MSHLTLAPDGRHKPISEYAKEIDDDWGFKINPAAFSYLKAMASIDQIEDMYGLDTAQGIVLRFLGNAQGWRGETARRIKAELKAIVAGCEERLAAKRHREAYQ